VLDDGNDCLLIFMWSQYMSIMKNMKINICNENGVDIVQRKIIVDIKRQYWMYYMLNSLTGQGNQR